MQVLNSALQRKKTLHYNSSFSKSSTILTVAERFKIGLYQALPSKVSN